jgi:hypothetical protein
MLKFYAKINDIKEFEDSNIQIFPVCRQAGNIQMFKCSNPQMSKSPFYSIFES